MAHRNRLQFLPPPLLVVLLMVSTATQLVGKETMSRVPKWQRWELTLKSSVIYTNPVQQAEMRVLFVSPLGETNRVYGFWDGGKEWKVRFKPSFPGRWQYYTMCSDTANAGLHGKSGEFLCTAAEGESRFSQHGPVQVARDQQHLEHADRTPFFWLGDAAWRAAIKSAPADWQEYIRTRAEQKFNAVQWQLSATTPDHKTTFFTGSDCIAVNPVAFRQLDAKIVAANKAGLLNAIAPLWEIGSAETLPEDQAIRLLRYVVARWGADDVAWIVAFECDSTGAQAARWQNIGRAVFNLVNHAPVVLLPGESLWICDAFRRERWVDILGIQTTTVRDENSLPWLLNGPLGQERDKQPACPLLTIAPPAEGKILGLAGAIDGDFSRQQLWWNTLLNTPAGVSYAAKDVSDWTDGGTRAAKADWREALSLPGAAAIAPLATSIATMEFWKLHPSTSKTGAQTGLRRLVVATTESQDLTLVYLPEAQSINLTSDLSPARTKAIWLNPRSGESQPAPASSNQQFTPPGQGDWLLVLHRLPAAEAGGNAKKTEVKIDKPRRD